MPKFRMVVLGAAAVLMVAGVGCQSRSSPSANAAADPPAQAAAAPAPTSAARGAQLVLLGACDDCHTPRLPNGSLDMNHRFSGHPAGSPVPPASRVPGAMVELNGAFRGPWGVSLASNLTPDPNHGIGKWSLQDFIQTMRTGKNPQGQALLPPMPVAEYGQLPDADLTALYNFLRTVPPSSNAVAGSK